MKLFQAITKCGGSRWVRENDCFVDATERNTDLGCDGSLIHWLSAV